jgi:hypothetical protein
MDPLSDVRRAARLDGAAISWNARHPWSVHAVQLVPRVFRKRCT